MDRVSRGDSSGGDRPQLQVSRAWNSFYHKPPPTQHRVQASHNFVRLRHPKRCPLIRISTNQQSNNAERLNELLSSRHAEKTPIPRDPSCEAPAPVRSDTRHISNEAKAEPPKSGSWSHPSLRVSDLPSERSFVSVPCRPANPSLFIFNNQPLATTVGLLVD